MKSTNGAQSITIAQKIICPKIGKLVLSFNSDRYHSWFGTTLVLQKLNRTREICKFSLLSNDIVNSRQIGLPKPQILCLFNSFFYQMTEAYTFFQVNSPAQENLFLQIIMFFSIIQNEICMFRCKTGFSVPCL